MSSETGSGTETLPQIGMGTWQLDEQEQCARSVAQALELGYRHVDTAQWYDNERGVGDGIAAADVDRDDVFLATKLWHTSLSHEEILEGTRESARRLGVETIDLLYVHWPRDGYDPDVALPAFEELAEQGLIDHIGVSNFEVDQLERAREVLDTELFAHQFEMHPLLPQSELCADAEAHDIECVAYSPLARGRVFDVPEIQSVADKHDVSEAQVSLAWLQANDVTPIPKASGQTHLQDNLDSRELTLDEDDMATLDGIETRHRCVDPDDAAWNRE